MATFGQFMRTTMHNFRMFWSASFGTTGRPLTIITEEMMADAMGEEKTINDASELLAMDEVADAQPNSPANSADAPVPDVEPTVAPDAEVDIDQPLDSDDQEPGDSESGPFESDDQAMADQDMPDTLDIEASLDSELAPELDPHSPELDDRGQPDRTADQEAINELGDNPDEDVTNELSTEVIVELDDGADLEPEPDADAEDTEIEDEEVASSPDSEIVVQGELELEDTAGELAPDIQIESHGKLLGLTTLLESLLFVSDEPVEASQLGRVLNISGKRVEAGIKRLDRLYESAARGLRVQVLDGRYQLVTAPETANAIEDFLNLDLTTKLSGPALEALAVIAYRQPVTRSQVEAVRGVDCAGVLRSLTQRGLVEEMGRLDTVGRPILYGVTDLFMQHFGLIKLGELPPLQVDDEDMLWAATKLAEMEQDEGS